MSAKTVIVSPSQMKNFATFLADSIKRMRGESKKMREATKSAKAVWKDAKYDAFHKQVEKCMDDLEKFNARGIKYSDFLLSKAQQGENYLRRR